MGMEPDEATVLSQIENAPDDETKLAVEAAAITATDNSARDGDHPDALKPLDGEA